MAWSSTCWVMAARAGRSSGGAQVKVTATWHIAIPPTVPLYWRAAPAQSADDQHHVILILA